MKCVVCKGSDISNRLVDEEVRMGNDIVLVELKALVCGNCGERYYDHISMQKIEKLKESLQGHVVKMEEVGKIFRALAA